MYTVRKEFSIEISDEFSSKISRLLDGKHSDDYLGIIGARLSESHLVDFVARPVVYDGDFGEGVNFWFSGFNLLVLESPPQMDTPFVLGQGPSWWIRYESVWDTKVMESMKQILSIRNPERQTQYG
jgi:hypothetical protein